MKYQTKETFMLKTVAEEPIVVARGLAAIDFGAMLVLNEAGAVMWKVLEEGCTADVLTDILVKKYDIDAAQAKIDANAFLNKCLAEELLDISEE